MPATRYKLWHMGNPVGRGVTGAYHVGMAGIAKCSDTMMPYTVANELVCGYIAKAVLLPVPPGFIMENSGVPYYVSMNFNLAGQDLPPANAAKITSNFPSLSWGVILFDMLIANYDRHDENIHYDSSSGKVQIFDHSHAFMVGSDSQSAKSDLVKRRNSAGIGTHCLAQSISSLDGLLEWSVKFKLIPEFYIREVVASTKTVGVSDDLAEFIANFLIERKAKLLGLVTENASEFPMLSPGLFDGLKKEN